MRVVLPSGGFVRKVHVQSWLYIVGGIARQDLVHCVRQAHNWTPIYYIDCYIQNLLEHFIFGQNPDHNPDPHMGGKQMEAR